MSNWRDTFSDAPLRTVERGALLFQREDRVRSMFLLRKGEVALERPMIDGTALTLHVVKADMLVAEASLFAEAYHCDAVACSDVELACLPRGTFLSRIAMTPEAMLGLIDAYSKELQALRARFEIMRLRRVCEKLDAWLELYGAPEKGEWVKVADAIGVSPPALYRELARRRKS